MAARTFVPTNYPLVDLETGKITSQWRRFQEGVSTDLTPGAANEVMTSNGSSLVWQKLLDANVAATAAIAWSKLSKTGSSLADLTTRSASDLGSGVLSNSLLTAALPWTPTDSSGAGLSLTSVEGRYVRIGPIVVAGATLTYPVTADASNSAIGNLPVVAYGNSNSIFGAFVTFTGEATLARMNVVTGDVQILPYTTAGARITNATLSGDTVRFVAVYLAS